MQKDKKKARISPGLPLQPVKALVFLEITSVPEISIHTHAPARSTSVKYCNDLISTPISLQILTSWYP